MPAVLVIAFGWLLAAGLCWCLGKLLLQALDVELFRAEEHGFAFVAGSACLSLWIFLLCAARLAYRGVFLATAAAIVGITLWRRAYRVRGGAGPPMPRFWRRLFYAVYAIYALLYVFAAFAPEASADGAGYHLGLARLYLRNHGFTPSTTDFHAAFPPGVEMLFLFALTWGRYPAAALLHCTYLLALPWLILSYARRQGIAEAGVTGALLVFASPVAGVTGTSAYNDLAVACVGFAVFAVLQIWDERREPALLALAGLLAGFAFAVKYTAFPAVLYATGFVAWRLLGSRKRVWRSLAIVAACAAALILPVLAKNWILVDNPVSPFFNRVFPNPYVHVSFEEDLAEQMRTYRAIHGYREIPLEVTMHGEKLQGLLGPAFLLVPLSLLAMRWKPGRRLLAAALLFALPYPANVGTRFLLPCMVFLAPALGLGLRWRPAAAALLIAHAIASWPGVVAWYSHAWRLQPPPLAAVIRRQPEETYLRARLAGYGAVELINQNVPPGERVFAFGDVPFAYCAREVLVGFLSASNERLRDMLWTGFIPDFQPRWQQVFRFAPQPLRRLRIVQTASRDPAIPSLSEVRIFGERGPIVPEPSWRFDARPFPWDASLAFDGRPLTRWRAWESQFPGMSCEVDFGAPRSVQAVAIEHTHDQWLARYQVQGDAGRGWTPLSASPESGAIAAIPDYRRLAVAELLSRGIRYLLVQAADYRAEEFTANAALWDMRPVAERAGAVLFRLGESSSSGNPSTLLTTAP